MRVIRFLVVEIMLGSVPKIQNAKEKGGGGLHNPVEVIRKKRGGEGVGKTLIKIKGGILRLGKSEERLLLGGERINTPSSPKAGGGKKSEEI